ncbi:MAG: AmmeMemoRadiSam system protein A [Phycisphaerales bacterium]|nr:AmmeMemoRadiSam system protein A [Phycisphaerales bacterium]
MDRKQQETLLRLARETLRARLTNAPLPPIPQEADYASTVGGVFVTLKNAGELRGCIGQFLPDTGLAETVQQMALSALCDPRFRRNPVTAEELDHLDLEISILSPMRRTDDPLSLELGKHGIYIRRGASAGCFLPQVADETGWSKEEFLTHCCAGKAGMNPDAWKDPDTEVYLFTAEVFGE